jgi:hypothetical protein
MTQFTTLDVWDRVTLHASVEAVVTFIRQTSADPRRTKYFMDREATVPLSVEALTEAFAEQTRDSVLIYVQNVPYRPSYKVTRHE